MGPDVAGGWFSRLWSVLWVPFIASTLLVGRQVEHPARNIRATYPEDSFPEQVEEDTAGEPADSDPLGLIG